MVTQLKHDVYYLTIKTVLLTLNIEDVSYW